MQPGDFSAFLFAIIATLLTLTVSLLPKNKGYEEN